MTENQIAVCRLLGKALFKVPFQENNEVDWKEVFCEMRQQRIQGLAFNSLSEVNIPKEVRESWENDVRKIVMLSTIIRHAQNDLVSLFEKGKIPYIVLKGTAIAAYYPEPRVRSLGDVDLYIPQNYYNQAIELMREKGYSEIKHESENPRHVCFMKDKVTFEVHRTYATVNSFEQRAYVDRLIDKSCIRKSEGVRDIGWVQYYDNGLAFRMPSITVNGIIVLEHIAHHLMYGIGLRQTIDWPIFAEKFLSDEYWPAFCDEARKAGC